MCNLKNIKFIEKSIKIHGDKYDYSKVNYVNNITFVLIGYKNIFYEISPANHLKGSKIENRKKVIDLESFKLLANKIHKNKYDYSKVEYKKNKLPIIIGCKIHGYFSQKMGDHLHGHGCMKCGKESMKNKMRLSYDDIVKKIENKHGEKYKYLNLFKNINLNTQLDIICPTHGEFSQKVRYHMNFGCMKCGYNLNTRNKGLDVFITESNIKWDNYYDYSKFNYINNSTKSIIICPSHGEFYQTPNIHMKSSCKKCGYFKNSLKSRMSQEEYISKCHIKHNNKYDYSNSNYTTSRLKIDIICPVHGKFTQNAQSHLSGTSCSNCSESKGEKDVRIFLEKNNIEFETQKRYVDCVFKITLPFDFHLTDYNMCIEFDGQQHFKSMKFFGGDDALEMSKLKDNIKTKYCLDNNIKLIRIPYWDMKNIETILKKELNIND